MKPNRKYSQLTNVVKSALLFAAAGVLSACGGSDGDSETQSIVAQTGVFIDSPVINIDYRTESASGTTNDEGEFTYLPGETITFFVNDVSLPEIQATNLVTPIDMALAMSNDADVQSSIVVNIARFLQSLDADNDPSNGIEIDEDVVTTSNLDFTIASDDFSAAFSNVVSTHQLISASSALEHLRGELSSRGLDSAVLDNFVLPGSGGETGGDTGGGDTGGGDTGGGDTGGGDTGGGDTGGGDTGGGDTGGGDTGGGDTGGGDTGGGDTGGGDTGGGDTGGGDTGGGDTGGGDTGGGDTGGGDTGGGDTGGGDTDVGDTGGEIDSPLTISALPTVVTNRASFSTPITLNGDLQKLVTLDVSIQQNYASLSVFSGDTLLIDNIDVPSAGTHTLKALVTFPETGAQELRFLSRSSDVTINAVTIEHNTETMAGFTDISNDIGFITEDTFKYGGPAIGDVNNDGHYDFVLANHNFIPPQLVTNNGDNTVSIELLLPNSQDFHGNALGDYDNDGDLDVMVALGGANGTSPTSYKLLKNNNGVFEDVSVASGINTPARGRSPRWADFDQDGDLDLMLANAATPNSDGPIQLFYRNMGDGTFTPVRVAGVESKGAERLLITDFNGDQIPDLVLYSPLSLWQGNGNFSFTNVSSDMLPGPVNNVWGINAITDVDVNNDGKLDLYLAFGKTAFQLSRKSIDFNPTSGELNIRDDGETGTTLIDFTAPGDLTLSELNLTYRQFNGNYPIFLGAAKDRKVVKATGFQPGQLPTEMLSADDTLTITQAEASGWPEDRTENGIYFGHTGDGNWKAEWVRDQNVYWNISFTLVDLSDVSYEWTPNNRNGQDILLINDGESFVNATTDWELPKGGDHWGVTHGDFNNDGFNDIFVHRYGFLRERVSDLLLLNSGENTFITTHMHGAFDHTDNGHGDMGQAFDFNKDGKVDMLNGSEEEGRWYLWENSLANNNNYLLVDVDYSPLNNVDSLGAKIVVTLESGEVFYKRVGSAGEVFSAGVIDTVHFGLGQTSNVTSVEVTWRNGEQVTMSNLAANTIVSTEDAVNPNPEAVELDASSLRLRLTTQSTLQATFTPLNANAGLSWTSGDDSIASVDAQGVVTANAIGETVITATSTESPSVSAQVTVEVTELTVISASGIEITGDDQSFYEGQQTQLSAIVTPSDADNTNVTWSSSAESVATVDETGLVSNLNVGMTTIAASADGSADGESVIASVDINVEALAAQSVAFDTGTNYLQDIAVSNNFEVIVDYHAGSGQVVNAAGIRFFLRELDSNWAPVNDIIIDELALAGTESGTAMVTFDTSNITLTDDLPAGNFYFLYVRFTNDAGELTDVGLSPLSFVAGMPETEISCDPSVNLLCGNTDGETSDVSDWYAYTRDFFDIDISNEISVSSEQANGGASSIKLAFNDGGVEQNFILRDVAFEVTEAGSYRLNVDVFGDNLSTGTDYVLEISFRPAGEPQNADTYKLWHRKTAGEWHALTTTQTLPAGNYIVGFKAFSPGFATALTLDYYVDNIVVTKL